MGKNAREREERKEAKAVADRSMPRASLRAVRISPRKASLVAKNIIGMRVSDALNVLQFTPKKAAVLLRQVVYSALSNASNNGPHVAAGVDVDGLVVKQVTVSEGPSWKRFMPRAQGRATQIIKRTSHITVILAEG